MKNDPVVAIAGVTGAVGTEFIAAMDIAADQLLKGAALNAIQIAERLN
ncbi:MAG: hypothetical protein ACJ8EK_14595 [Bradyrhizobium sp.]